jgi:hypothetical protein
MKIDNQHELVQQTSDQNLQLTSDWEGKEVTVHPKITEASKKSETVFKKMKKFMNAAWKAKYKILLATVGVLTAAATATCLSIFLAKKMKSKALTNAEPKDNQPPVSEDQEIKEEEKVSSKLVHLTLDRPKREGIRRPTSTKPYETLLKQRQVASDEKMAELLQVQEEKELEEEQPIVQTLPVSKEVISDGKIAELLQTLGEDEQAIIQTPPVSKEVISDEKIAELLKTLEEEQPIIQQSAVTEQVTSDEKIAELLQVEEAKVAEKQQPVVDKQKTEKQDPKTVRKQHKIEKKRRADEARLAKKRRSLAKAVAKMTKRIHKK